MAREDAATGSSMTEAEPGRAELVRGKAERRSGGWRVCWLGQRARSRTTRTCRGQRRLGARDLGGKPALATPHPGAQVRPLPPRGPPARLLLAGRDGRRKRSCARACRSARGTSRSRAGARARQATRRASRTRARRRALGPRTRGAGSPEAVAAAAMPRSSAAAGGGRVRAPPRARTASASRSTWIAFIGSTYGLRRRIGAGALDAASSSSFASTISSTAATVRACSSAIGVNRPCRRRGRGSRPRSRGSTLRRHLQLLDQATRRTTTRGRAGELAGVGVTESGAAAEPRGGAGTGSESKRRPTGSRARTEIVL